MLLIANAAYALGLALVKLSARIRRRLIQRQAALPISKRITRVDLRPACREEPPNPPYFADEVTPTTPFANPYAGVNR